MNHRKYFVTLNRYTCFDYEYCKSSFKRLCCQYGIVGKEVGKQSGIPHLHVYFKFKNRYSFKKLQKLLPHANIQEARGNDDQITTYIKKEGKTYVYGSPSSQGDRTDLKRASESIKNGQSSCRKILLENPDTYHTFGRTLEKIEDIVNRNKVRTTRTKGLWIYGPTGTGKSHEAFRGYDVDNFYVKPLDEKDVGWWDAYNGQDVVILDEFRGQLSFDTLLKLCDKYPYSVSRRCREPIQMVSLEVRITSCYHPKDIYKTETLDTLKQLYRRFELVFYPWKGGYSILIENVTISIINKGFWFY